MTVYGYVRVSSSDQNEERQVLAMKERGVSKQNLYIDKQSGRDFLRPAYKALVARLKPGDILYIQSIDRLGRDYEEILDQWKILTKDIGVHISVIDLPLLDSFEDKDDLINIFIAEIVLQILSFVAETEADNIKKRQAEGIKAAKDKGVRFGRPSIDLPVDFDQLVLMWNTNRVSLQEVLDTCNISQSTFYRRLKELTLA
jgi:DNA invertase Pin-like site-specific DNA recombinase